MSKYVKLRQNGNLILLYDIDKLIKFVDTLFITACYNKKGKLKMLFGFKWLYI